MTVTTDLLRLQEIDSEIERLEAELATARRRQRRNPEWEAAEKRLDTLRKEEAQASAEQRSLEADLQDVERKIARDRSRMYGGAVVDPREIASLERELEHLAGRRDGLEDTLLALMERVEGLQSSLAAASREANTLQERWETDRPELARREEALVDTIAGMRGERDALVARIEPRALSMYTRLRTNTGQAIATIRSGVCGICRVTLPPKDVQHVRLGTLVPCPNCGRILASPER